MFVNFAKKQSDNLEQQEASPPGGGPSPLQHIISLLKSRPANTELNALISEAPEELESDDDEGLISFEEERVRASFMWTCQSVFDDMGNPECWSKRILILMLNMTGQLTLTCEVFVFYCLQCVKVLHVLQITCVCVCVW